MTEQNVDLTLQNNGRRPSIPFAAIGRVSTRQNPQAGVGCPCCGAQIAASRPFVDATTRSVIYKNASVLLSPMELSILDLLTKRFPAVVGLDSLIGHVWPSDEPEDAGASLKVTISRMRAKIGLIGLGVTNVFEVGYRVVPK